MLEEEERSAPLQVKKIFICAHEAKADIGLSVADDYDDDDDDYDPGIKCTKLA